MVRLPREEIDYKKVYKQVHLDRDLGIIWPETDNEQFDGCLDLSALAKPEGAAYVIDQFDEQFCNDSGIKPGRFMEIYKQLDTSFNRHILSQLDALEPLLPAAHTACDICGRAAYGHDRGHSRGTECANEDSPAGSGEESATEMDDEDSMHVCNGCGIAVHRECYGIQNTQDQFWFCTGCIFSDWKNDKNCLICDNRNGILKLTSRNEWVHAVCASVHPLLSFANTKYKEPVSTNSLKKCTSLCGVCGNEAEYLVSCRYFKCRRKYHASCAAEHLYTDLNNRVVYCPEHNFLGRGPRIISRRKFMGHRTSFAFIEHEIFLRKPLALSRPSRTRFTEIIEQEPAAIFAVCAVGDFTPDTERESVIQYWKAKRSAFGTYFIDPFMFIGHLNGTEDDRDSL